MHGKVVLRADRPLRRCQFVLRVVLGERSPDHESVKPHDRITSSKSSAMIRVIGFNIIYNNSMQLTARHYLESNRLAFMTFMTLAENIGINVSNLLIRNYDSLLDYLKLVNNSATLSWKISMSSHAQVVFKHFSFL
jgi:hypothetical protein